MTATVPTFDTDNVVQAIPLKLIDRDPANLRDDLGDLTGLADSIRVLGVLEPVLVRAHPDKAGRFMLVAGERRLAAAKIAAGKTIPALVRADSDETRDHVMLVENLQRAELTPIQEARGFKRLADAGWSQRRIAKEVGCNQGHVSKRIALLTLPDAALGAIDRGAVTVQDALELTKLADHPADIEAVVASIAKGKAGYWNGGSVASQVEGRIQTREREQAVADLSAELEAKGLRVATVDDYGNPLGSANTLDVLELDGRKHRAEPCHAAQVLAFSWQQPTHRLVCTDPKRHRAAGVSTLKVAKGAGAGKSAEQRERDAQAKADAKRRAEFMRHLVAAGTVHAAAVDDLGRLGYLELVTMFDRVAQAALDLLGIQLGKDDSPELVLMAYARKSEAHLRQAIHATWLVRGERHQSGAYLAHLENYGLELTDLELERAAGDLEAERDDIAAGLQVLEAHLPELAPASATCWVCSHQQADHDNGVGACSWSPNDEVGCDCVAFEASEAPEAPNPAPEQPSEDVASASGTDQPDDLFDAMRAAVRAGDDGEDSAPSTLDLGDDVTIAPSKRRDPKRHTR